MNRIMDKNKKPTNMEEAGLREDIVFIVVTDHKDDARKVWSPIELSRSWAKKIAQLPTNLYQVIDLKKKSSNSQLI